MRGKSSRSDHRTERATTKKTLAIATSLALALTAGAAWAQNGESKKAEYCAQVMSQKEIDALREQLAKAGSEEEEREILREHLEEVLEGAAELPMSESPACEYGN